MSGPISSPFKDYFGENIDISSVKGNASPTLKKHIAILFRLFRSRSGKGFVDDVGASVDIISIDVDRVGSKKRAQSTVICECTVTEGKKSA